MTRIDLHPVAGSDPGLKDALSGSGLGTEDLEASGRTFFMAVDGSGTTVGYSGLELCAGDVLLRSLVVLPAHRGKSLGRALVDKTLAMVADGARVYLATTSAAAFFETLGFSRVGRSGIPAAVLSTRQLSGLCPASATIMTRNAAAP